eukprot:TRINITY_DN1447_c0_g3_i1.p1 TRINITY_DN1447_c0_g3~~TRINITY_DN1447_c0_g3_i1.p1  ORF type:complete len:348 (-),score=38.75 TRINITY_DN1447_c0_g3_i1:187-1230(-)
MSTTEVSYCSPVLEEQKEVEVDIQPHVPKGSITISTVQHQQISQSFLSSIVAIITMTFMFGLVLYGPLLLVGLITRLITDASTTCFTILLVIFYLTIAPSRGPWKTFLSHPIWATWREYFNFKVICTGNLNQSRQLLFAEFPHAVFPMGFWLSATSYKELNIRPVTFAVASVLFRVPIIRCFCFWSGCVPAVRKSLVELLDRGESLAILPGGIAEIFVQSRDVEYVFLSERKGFVRMAIEMGVDIVPVYHLGNTSLFDYSNSSFLTRWSRKLRISLVFFWGRFFLPLPYRKPVVKVIGEPIPVKKNSNPSADEINEVHSKFVEALGKLFHENKHHIPGWESKQLVVL